MALGLVSSCQDYLGTTPDSSLKIEINSEEKISELLAGAYPQASYFAFLEARTDNVGERANGQHSQLNEAMYFWEDYDQEDLDTPLNYWNACYQGIAQANQALELLAAYPKTDRVKALYGEAFLLRAYLHFMLINIWAEPYGAEKSKHSLGIPYLTKPEKNALVNYGRSSVQEVYQKIENDLILGISLVNDKYYKNPKFRFNKKAAYAFASRFYLIKGEWDLVIQYANFVLGFDPKSVLRNWNKYSQNYSQKRQLLYQTYTDSQDPANLLLTATESRVARNYKTEKYGLNFDISEKLYRKGSISGCSGGARKDYNLFDFYLFNASENHIYTGRYIAKFDELSLFANISSKPRDLFVTNVLFSTDEVLLNRMEAYAMKKEYSKAVNDILTYTDGKYGAIPDCTHESFGVVSNKYYADYTPFYGMTTRQLAFVKIALDFRQKEFMHEGLRWFDIRRFYIAVKRSTNHPLYKPLAKEDPRKLLQIPSEAIKRGLQPNPR